jgi:hypothetical protein
LKFFYFSPKIISIVNFKWALSFSNTNFSSLFLRFILFNSSSLATKFLAVSAIFYFNSSSNKTILFSLFYNSAAFCFNFYSINIIIKIDKLSLLRFNGRCQHIYYKKNYYLVFVDFIFIYKFIKTNTLLYCQCFKSFKYFFFIDFFIFPFFI